MGLYLTDRVKLSGAVRTAIANSAHIDEQTNLLEYDLKVGEKYLDDQDKLLQEEINSLWKKN